MKYKKCLTSMCMLIIGYNSLIASNKNDGEEWKKNSVVSLFQLSESALQDFSQGKMSQVIVECPQGTHLPFATNVKGEYFALESTKAPLLLLQTFYVRCEQPDEFLFSTDQTTWKNFSDFFTGKISLSVHKEGEDLVSGLELEFNQRKS